MATLSKGRVEAFCDGIFAIIVTLLVLEIKVPHLPEKATVGHLAVTLVPLAPKILSWIVSFLTVCVIWINHHRIFSVIGGLSNRVFWWNANLLMWISFIPFPTALMGDFPLNSLAVSIYGAIMTLMGLSFYLLRRAILAEGSERHPHLQAAAFRGASRTTLYFAVLPYAAAAAIAWLHPVAAAAIYLFVPLYFIFPRQR